MRRPAHEAIECRCLQGQGGKMVNQNNLIRKGGVRPSAGAAAEGRKGSGLAWDAFYKRSC